MKWSRFFCLLLLILPNLHMMAQKDQPIWKNSVYALYADSVVQQQWVAKAPSSSELVSTYQSMAGLYKSSRISFKFSINGKDNEMRSGTDHHFSCVAAEGAGCQTPLIQFGKQLVDAKPVADNTYLKPRTHLLIRLDMRGVLDAFNKDGFFTTFNGDKIYKQDFKGVWVAGNTAPLIWDFDNLVNRPELKLQDADGDGIYETTLTLNDPDKEQQLSPRWKLSANTAAFPQYSSSYPISDAVYNLALEEMQHAIEPDSTFRTGKEWAGVWTRDISYSIILSMAYLQPRVARYSLLRKVNKDGKIIQDTGTGGAWPASTDRMIWAAAAWEVYQATGDEDWLKQAYAIIKHSVEDDMEVAYDGQTGLVKGESSFLDWREQTYPRWMQPVDIYESECLGTNAVHFRANQVLADMAALLGEQQTAAKHRQIADRIKKGINQYLWMPQKGYYGQFLYGRHHKILSPRSEALGEALTVLFDIADPQQQQQIIRNTPVMEFGIPCIYPQIPGIPPYHNNAVWPFVQSYWALAAAKAGNEQAVLESISAIYRPAALFATNKENFVADNGDWAGTQINSSNMLWSLSGNLSLVHKLLFGIRFEEKGLVFQPFVPAALKGTRNLTNFSYRQAVLDMSLEGFGNQIKACIIDGKAAAPSIPATLQGHHTIRIELANAPSRASKTNTVAHRVSPDYPILRGSGNTVSWNKVAGAQAYKVVVNGKEAGKTTDTSYKVRNTANTTCQVVAVDAKGTESFASEPLVLTDAKGLIIAEAEEGTERSSLPYTGYTGRGFVEISKTKNTSLPVSIDIPEDGDYFIDVRYANGNGPTNTENKCAIRTLGEGKRKLGTLVMPQRGKEEWSNWGWSNAIGASLKKGSHVLTISFEPFDENMNGAINQAMIDCVRVMKRP